ncbi:MAG: threonine ammonia-lyase [Polyangiaceae bacterium]|nr:threonine ammonia-lyase [Polyangiaceae bacterium]
MLDLAAIQAAAVAIREGVRVSPCAYSERLSELTGTHLFFKLENLQLTGSFKERGACNKLLSLSAAERAHGVVAASAGNHAQGVAYHAKRLGIDATIVMPESTPLVKIAETRRHGGNVILFGHGYDDAFEEAMRIVQRDGRAYIHAFDDPAIICGQGTIGLELMEQVPNLDAVIVAVGGGGLAGGIALAVKSLNPKVRVIGVEAEQMPTLRKAQEAGKPVRIQRQKTLADGIAVGQVGNYTFDLLNRYLDDLVLVDDEEVAEAILLMLEGEKTVAEGAGAAPLAALRHRNLGLTGKTVALVVGGGNIDVNLVSRIIERGLTKSGRTMRLHATLDDVPGTLARLISLLGQQNANILQVEHDRRRSDDFGKVFVEILAETRSFEHIENIVATLRSAGFQDLRVGLPASLPPTQA